VLPSGVLGWDRYCYDKIVGEYISQILDHSEKLSLVDGLNKAGV